MRIALLTGTTRVTPVGGPMTTSAITRKHKECEGSQVDNSYTMTSFGIAYFVSLTTLSTIRDAIRCCGAELQAVRGTHVVPPVRPPSFRVLWLKYSDFADAKIKRKRGF